MVRMAVTTRERILEGAFTLFGRYGFRRTSMEDIASESGLSRAALYLQFRNKEDIFRDLSRGLHEDALAQAGAALQGPEPLAQRLQMAVEAKTLRMIEITHTSAHGSELMDENNRLCGDLATESEGRFQAMLASAFSRASASGEIELAGAGLTAVEAADVFAHSAQGLKGPGTTTDAYRARLASLVKVFVSGMGG